jgi:AcrR family transcriptional regulator
MTIQRRSQGPVATRRRTGAAPRGSYHHGDLRRALVAAAARLIERGGGARPTLRAAAAAAGVSVAAPYRHFADRQALLAAVLAEGFRELARCTEEARSAGTEPMAALAATGVAYVRFAAGRPRTYRLMFGPECDKLAYPDLLDAGHAALAVLHRAVSDCSRAGMIDDAGVQQVALAGWSLTHGLASLHVDGLLADNPVARDLEATARTLVDMLVDGVRAWRPQAATGTDG